jgi:hypothetical protein
MKNLMNITYPSFLYQFHNLWKRVLCKGGFHLFDEVVGSWDYGQHYLVCDACDLEVIIDDDPTHTHDYQLKEIHELR